MLVLGLDTTARPGSVALTRDGARLDVLRATPTAHAPAAACRPLRSARPPRPSGLRDVDVFAVAAGPGSFTGLRIGIAAIQGLAFAAGRPVVGVSALEALALAGLAAGGLGNHT